MCSHILHKKNRWYYRRRIPTDVQKLHVDPKTRKPKSIIYFSLETDDKALACKKADAETRRLDEMWKRYREGGIKDIADPAISVARLKAAGLAPGDGAVTDSHGLTLPPVDEFIERLVGMIDRGETPDPISAQDKLTLEILHGAPVPKTLLDAKELYVSMGKGPKNKVAQGQYDRAWNALLDITGNKYITDLRRADANEFVKRLLESGKKAETVRKYVVQISAPIKMAILEFELDCKNHFADLQIAKGPSDEGEGRLPYAENELRAIQAACKVKDDPRRWLIAALSDTGARLSELLGMEQGDVFLDAPIPYIAIRPNETRRVKTSASVRDVPLVGVALWAVQRAMSKKDKHLFPDLIPRKLGTDFDSGAVSSALGKWLKDNDLAKQGQVIHSFRHSMADRLRNAGVQKELLEAIGGWDTKGMSSAYGQGFSLEVKRTAMMKILL